MPLPHRRPPVQRTRGGFTLVELIVVLAILGLSAVVVSTVRPAGGGMPTQDDVVLRARRMAVQRAQVLTLRIEADGRWAVIAAAPGGAGADDSVASGGGLRAAETPLRILIDAMGSCHPVGGDRGARFDPLRCQWLTAESAP